MLTELQGWLQNASAIIQHDLNIWLWIATNYKQQINDLNHKNVKQSNTGCLWSSQ